MTTLNSNQLVVTIHTSSPAEYRNCLIQAIAAALRWKSNCLHQKNTDDEHAVQLSELLEVLAQTED